MYFIELDHVVVCNGDSLSGVVWHGVWARIKKGPSKGGIVHYRSALMSNAHYIS